MSTEQVNEQLIEVEQSRGVCSRSFKVKLEQNGQLYGRYNGDSPYQAANKALSEIIRNRIKNEQPIDENINFFLVESTKGSKRKMHEYVGKRIKLETPVEYSVAQGVIIRKEYKNILRKVKQQPVRRTRQRETTQQSENAPVILSTTENTVTISTN